MGLSCAGARGGSCGTRGELKGWKREGFWGLGAEQGRWGTGWQSAGDVSSHGGKSGSEDSCQSSLSASLLSLKSQFCSSELVLLPSRSPPPFPAPLGERVLPALLLFHKLLWEIDAGAAPRCAGRAVPHNTSQLPWIWAASQRPALALLVQLHPIMMYLEGFALGSWRAARF